MVPRAHLQPPGPSSNIAVSASKHMWRICQGIFVIFSASLAAFPYNFPLYYKDKKRFYLTLGSYYKCMAELLIMPKEFCHQVCHGTCVWKSYVEGIQVLCTCQQNSGGRVGGGLCSSDMFTLTWKGRFCKAAIAALSFLPVPNSVLRVSPQMTRYYCAISNSGRVNVLTLKLLVSPIFLALCFKNKKRIRRWTKDLRKQNISIHKKALWETLEWVTQWQKIIVLGWLTVWWASHDF
jgi:hypothetical protein